MPLDPNDQELLDTLEPIVDTSELIVDTGVDTSVELVDTEVNSSLEPELELEFTNNPGATNIQAAIDNLLDVISERKVSGNEAIHLTQLTNKVREAEGIARKGNL